MAGVKINTDSAFTAAQTLKKINNDIRNEFGKVQTAMSKLDSAWDGNASFNSISTFNRIKSTYSDSRYKVINNYVNFILNQVGEGYEQTESANVSLAESFR